MSLRLLVAAFLLAHGLIHAGYLTPRPPATPGGPKWPFDLGSSWALTLLGSPTRVTRVLGLALVALTMAGFALAALAALGPLPTAVWSAAVAVGAVASLALLTIFFQPMLLIGVGIDLVLLWVVLVAGWAPAPG